MWTSSIISGVSQKIALDLVPETKVGHYVIVHVGFAISKVSEEDAHETLRILREISDIEEELGMHEDQPSIPGTIPS